MRVGDHDAYEEVARTATTAVWKVRDARSSEEESGGGGGGRVAKVLRPAVFWEADETARRAREFVDRAEIQERVAAGAEHWAPIHDKGGTDEGAFYVTDYYPSTADELIRKKVGIAAPELYRIIGEVISGLEELKEAGARSHGDLMPTNVLLTADNHEEASVRLTDPASDRAATDSGEAGDCHAVGKLIFALVMQRMPREGEGPPQKPTGGWSSLGRRGRRWRDLCARLLQPHATDGGIATLEQLRAQWKRCAPEKVSTKRLAVATVAAILLVGGVVAGGIYAYSEPFDQRNWETLYQESQDWFDRFVQSVRKGQHHDATIKDSPLLQEVFREIRANPKLTAEEIAGGNAGASKSTPPDSVKTREAIRQTHKAVLVMTKVQQRLDEWQKGVGARVPDRFANVGGAPGELAKAIAKLEATVDKTAGGSRRHNLDAIIAVVRYEKWMAPLTGLDAAVAEVEKEPVSRRDPMLSGLGQFAVDWVKHWSFQGTPGAHEQVAALAATVRKLAVKLPSPTLAWDEFLKADWRASAPPLSTERLDRFDLWLRKADEYEQLAEANDPRKGGQVAVAHWEAADDPAKSGRTVRFSDLLTDLNADRAKAEENDPEAARLMDPALEKLRADHAALGRETALQKDKEALAKKVGALLESGRKVRGDLWALTQTDPDPVKKQFKDKWEADSTIVQDSPLINRAWVAQRDDLIKARGTVRSKTPKLQKLREYLIALNSSYVAPLEVPEAQGRPWMDALESRAKARRDQGLKTLVDSFRWAGNTPVPEFESQRTQAQTALSEWRTRAADAARACAAMEDALNGYYLPEDAPGGGRPSIKESSEALGRVSDPDIVDALKVPVGRAKGLIGFVRAATADRSRARREIEAGQTADEALDYFLAAVRLVDDTVPPDVTRTAVDKASTELTERAKARSAASDKQRLAALAEQLMANWVTRARGQVNAPPAPVAHEVIAGADALAAGPASELEPRLDDRGRFNLSMFRLVAAINAKDEERTKALLPTVEGLAQKLQIRPSADNELGRAVMALAKAREEKKGTTPATEQGPARAAVAAGVRAKWQVQELNDRVVYTLLDETAGRARGTTLTFVDVGKGSYLCTTEVSLALLAYMLKENPGLFSAFKQLEDKLSPNKLNARTWLIGGQAVTLQHEVWVYVGSTGQMFTPGREGTVKAEWEHPVTYITLPLARRLAAKLGCYLPTVEEWQAALQKEVAGGTRAQWNVRDAGTWDANLKNPLFTPDNLQNYSALTNNARTVSWGENGGRLVPGAKGYDDGYLWFAPAETALKNKPAPNVFVHLLGNVAEYVELDAAAREKFPIDELADDVKNEQRERQEARRQPPPKLTAWAMGESALSAPRADVTKPQHLTIGATYGYSDVGLRLAMPNPGPRTYERLAAAKLTDLKPYFVRQ